MTKGKLLKPKLTGWSAGFSNRSTQATKRILRDMRIQPNSYGGQGTKLVWGRPPQYWWETTFKVNGRTRYGSKVGPNGRKVRSRKHRIK